MIHVIVLGFDTLRRCSQTVLRFRETTNFLDLKFKITLVDAKYPEKNKWPDSFSKLARCLDVSLLNLDKNYGQDGNYNKIKDLMHFKDSDFIVYYDTDVAPTDPEWLRDTMKVFTKPDAGFVCMNCSSTDDSLANQGELSVIEGVRVREICWPGGWPNGVWRGKFLNKVTLAHSHEFYGGTEGSILNALRQHGYKGYMLVDHDDARELKGQDGAYQAWKASVISSPGKQESFEAYLARQS